MHPLLRKHPVLRMWAQTDSNRRPSACKADALNQLSYAPESNCRYFIPWWAQTDSNRRPSACKADALNQLSYAPGITFGFV